MKMLHSLLCVNLLPQFVLLFCVYYVFADATYFSVHSNIKCIGYERDALLQFKRGIKSDYCGLLSSWGDHNDCCQWRGVTCSNITGHVMMLQLQEKGYDSNVESCLEGNVDPSLFKLKHLRYLDLSFNLFSQTIPKSIGSLTDLEYLNLSNAGFYGEIPQKLGNLSKLEYLDLNRGHDDNIPIKNLRLSNLKLLKYIDLSGIDLSGVGKWSLIFKNMRSLKVLHMNNCQLSATVPSPFSFTNFSNALRVVSLSGNNINDTSIFQWLFNLSKNGNKLEYIDLSYNLLSGMLPRSFENMHSLELLDLTYNQLEGPFLNIFADLRSLSFLSLTHNKFHGSIIKTLGNLCKLQGLYLKGNMFSDDLSNVIQTLAKSCINKPLIRSLDLSKNLFWGSVPESINKLSSLKELYLDDNHLNGTITQGIGQLLMLEKLDLSSNSLKCVLNHNHFSKLSQLRELYLSDNQALAINMDVNWVPPFQLDIISLRSCKLGPVFPNWLLTQTNFSYVDISNTQISGNIPLDFWLKSFSMSSNLQLLNMSNNMIHGTIPNLPITSITLSMFCEFDLSSNYFEGSIPSFLGAYAYALYLNNNMFSNATHILCPTISFILLRNLDVSHNFLTGELQDSCWIKSDHIESLHLENNNLSGHIPTSIGAMKNLKYLHLENNSFSGKLPKSLMNCTSLVILNLGDNSLSGYIPPDIGHVFVNLGLLNFRRNNFVGKMPLSLCQLSNLQILDLGMNHLSGEIPNCIYNFTAMTLDRSQDLLIGIVTGTGIGRVPFFTEEETAVIEWKRVEQMFRGSLRLVKSVDLSYNELEGAIPTGISNLNGLISLDLSRNNLTGSLTSDIGQLTSLELLDLSNNYLSGEIPASLAKVSTLGTLSLSNNNLSGKIPVGTQLQSFDHSSYSGNPLLCGTPLQECLGDQHNKTLNDDESLSKLDQQRNDDVFPGVYVSIVLGFIIGFWGICGTLVMKRSWRFAFFKFFDDMKDNLYVAVAIRKKP